MSSVAFTTAGTDMFVRTGGLPLPAAGTILGWANTVSIVASNYIFGVENTGATNSFHLFVHNTDGVLRIDSNVADASDATGAIPINTWKFFAMKWSGASAANIVGYKDGVAVINQTNGAMGDIAKISVSSQAGSKVCNVMLYNVALGDREIAAQMRYWMPLRFFDLLGWWPMRWPTVAESQIDASSWANNFATAGAGISVVNDEPTIAWNDADTLFIPSPVISVVPVLPNLGLYFSDTMLAGNVARAGLHPLWVRGQVTLPIGTQLQAGNQIQLFRLGQFNRLFWMSMDVNGGMDGGAGGAGGLQGTLTDGSNSYLLNSSNLLVNASSLSSFQSVLQSGGRVVLGRTDQAAGPLGGFTTQATDSIVYINVTQAASGAMVAPSLLTFTAMVF